jgi:proteasome lid subunit RPN8/RPN11
MEQERLQKHWQKRLAKMEQEFSRKRAQQAAESDNMREECNVAMTRVHSHPNVPCFPSNVPQKFSLMIILGAILY